MNQTSRHRPACLALSMLFGVAALNASSCASSEDRAQDAGSGDKASAQGSKDEDGDPSESPGKGSSSPSKEPSPSGDSGSDDGGEDSGDDGEDDAGQDSEDGELPSAKFDLGTLPKAESKKGAGEIVPCEIDFLFVVDNSGSMYERQRSLSNSVPKFAETMMTSTDMEKDFHIGVVTTDESRGNIRGCNFLGGLVVQTRPLVTDIMCGPYSSGKNFMTHKDDLSTTFTCAAKPGIGGNVVERPLDALRGAIDAKNAGAGDCNESFMREEALLAVVIITDEDDGTTRENSQGNPEQWYQKLLAAKGGDEKKLVVISIVVPPKPNDCDPSDAFNRPTENIIEFTKKFGERGFVADVCSSDYDPLFKKAVSVIDFACGELHPPPG